MRFDITRINEGKFTVHTTREDCVTLFKLFFRKKYDVRSLYNAQILYIADVVKTVLDCSMLQDVEKIILIRFVEQESNVNIERLYTKRNFGKRRLEEINRLSSLYSNVNIVQIY